MTQSSINGRAVPLEAAIAEAARLIAKSRHTVIAGLGADVAGARAAIRLADRIGGSIDHMHSLALLHNLAVMRAHGVMLTTPGEARFRSDVVLLVGDGLNQAGLLEIWPDLQANPHIPTSAPSRRIIQMVDAATSRQRSTVPFSNEKSDTRVNGGPLPLGLIGALRARLNGSPTSLSAAENRKVDAVAATLLSAAFGVAVWSAASLDVLTIEMLCGLVKDLNANTRFTGLPLTPGDNADGVLQTCAWMTGLPIRTGFARRYPEHDPWTFDSERLVESGEADCALWISAYRAATPRWRKPFPVVALTNAGAEFTQTPAVHIAVGRPGVDHAGIDYCARMATFAARSASHDGGPPSVADVIGRLIAALEGATAASC
jgi:formylmethanofuran dehydrogenase subunit B